MPALMRRPSLPQSFMLVRANRYFRYLVLGRATSAFGGWIAFIALGIYAFNLTHSATWVGALMLAQVAPGAVIGLTLAPLVDRLPRRRLLIASDLVNCTVFAVIPFTSSVYALVALAGVTGIASTFFRPALYAGLPNLVAADELSDANSLLSALENLSWAGGPLIAGLLIAAEGTTSAFVVNAATFLVSALSLAVIPQRRFQSERALGSGHWRDLADGIRLIRTSRPLTTVLIAWNMAVFPMAAFNVAELTLARVTLDAGTVGYSALIAAAGAGQVAGNLLVAPQIRRFGLSSSYGYSLALMALSALGIGLSPTIAVAIAFSFLAGVTNGGALVCNIQIMQKGAPDQFRGRVLTTLGGTMSIVGALGIVVSGAATDALGSRVVLGSLAALLLASASVALYMLRGWREGEPSASGTPAAAT